MKTLNMLHQKYSKKAKDSRRGKNIRESLEKQGDGQQLPDVEGFTDAFYGRPEPDRKALRELFSGYYNRPLTDLKVHFGISDQSDAPKK